VRDVLDYLDRLSAEPAVRTGVWVGGACLIILLLARVLRSAARRHIDDADLRYRVRKGIGAAAYLVVALLLLAAVGGRLSGLALALGVVGAGLAFALQEVIASVAGWLALSLGNYYRVGDRIQLGGVRGDVIDIGVLRTTLMELGGWVDGDLYNGRMVRVANSAVFKEPVFNYSGEFPFLWDEIVVPVRHGCDRALARRLLETAARDVVGPHADQVRKTWERLVRSYRIEDSSLDPMITLTANDNWMAFTVRYVVDCKRRRVTKDALFERILSDIDATAGKVMIASTTLELTQQSHVRVAPPTGA